MESRIPTDDIPVYMCKGCFPLFLEALTGSVQGQRSWNVLPSTAQESQTQASSLLVIGFGFSQSCNNITEFFIKKTTQQLLWGEDCYARPLWF